MNALLESLAVTHLPPQVDPQLIRDLVNLEYGLLGRTASTRTESNTSGEFRFRLTREAAEARSIDIGSTVVAISDDQRELVFAAVNQLNCYGMQGSVVTDEIDYTDRLPGDGEQHEQSDVIIATCAVVQTLSGKSRPVTSSRVFFPTSLGIQFAFGIVDTKGKCVYKGAAVPVGLYENGDGTIAPVSIDENFIVGPEAAHLNVSGISGLASKTSTLQFCLKSLLTKSTKNVGVVVINVKSKDLLYIDQMNHRLLEHEWSMKVYKDLDMPVEPFSNARFFAPSHPKKRGSTQSQRLLKTEPFRWDLNLLYRDLPSLFDSTQADNSIEGAWFVIREEIEKGVINTYAEMMTWLDKLLTQGGLTEWPKGYATATWRRLKADLRRCAQQYRGLIAEDDEGADIAWDDLKHQQVFVIDIEMLSDSGQKLVFGRCIRALTKMLENRVNDLDSIVIFVDELNKFAPKAEKSAIKSQLIEVTARGRSLGLILFGAEQFASSVDMQIVENSSTFMFGRTESTEMSAVNYNGLSPEMKARLRLLPQGQTLIKFPKFPQPLFIRFPFPSALPGDDFRLPEGYVAEGEAAVVDGAVPAVADGVVTNGAHPAGAPGTEAPKVPVAPAKPAPVLPNIEPGSLLRRYQAGEHEAVWEEMMSLGRYVRDPRFYDDAWAVSRETMRRARHNIEIIIRRLDELNYHFRAGSDPREDNRGEPAKDVSISSVRQLLSGFSSNKPATPQTMIVDHLQDKNVFLPSGPREVELAAELEAQGVYLPMSLRAWFEEVGRVDLTGSHPTLSFMQGKNAHWGVLEITEGDGRKLCYGLSRANVTIGRSRTAGNDIVLLNDDKVSTLHARIENDRAGHVSVVDLGSTNGITVNDIPVNRTRLLADGDVIGVGHSKIVFQVVGADRPGRGASEGTYVDPLVVFPTAEWIMDAVQDALPLEDVEPSDLYISSYDTDKTSATPDDQREAGYTLTLPNVAADGFLMGERHKTTFVNYLRVSFKWGGFPGWERYKSRPSEELAFLTEGLLPL